MNIVLKEQEYAAEILSPAQAVAKLRGSKGSWHESVFVVAVDAEGKPQERVTIYGPDKAMWSPEGEQWYSKGTEINWSALGSQKPEVTRLYGTMLKVAADLADEANATLTFVDRDTAWTAYHAHRETVTAGHADAEGNVLHEQNVEDCDKCSERARIIKAAEELDKQGKAKLAQKRADKLHRTANNRHDLWPAGPMDNDAVQREYSNWSSAVYQIGNCTKRSRRDRSTKHVMNADGQCEICRTSISTLEALMADKLAEVARS